MTNDSNNEIIEIAAAIQVIGLGKTFGSLPALDSVTFTVAPGDIFGLVGPDGAGKSTCLRILSGLMLPSSGQAFVLGRDVIADPESVKPDIGYMAQPAGLYDDLTVAENIEFYAEMHQVSRSKYQERMDRLLKFSGLAPFTGRLFRNLSGGMKQKAGLTCALIHSPKVLLLDEPTNGVDPVSRRDFWKILYELKREQVTVVVASTYLDEADRCHRIALFDQGRIRLVMEPTAMRGLMPGRLYNILCSDRRTALKVLKEQPQVRTPSLFGAGLHFTLADDRSIPIITERLREAGLTNVDISAIQPSLEDVYLTLVE
ncbi:MAG: ABC transporter ATP-binding protein [Deltaproteobacteria bacterium]|nr:ABC transporter ATP-binding protein [Deltaproteobacteria bacterium]